MTNKKCSNIDQTLKDVLKIISRDYMRTLLSDGFIEMTTGDWIRFFKKNDSGKLKKFAKFDKVNKSLHLLNETKREPLKGYFLYIIEGGEKN